MCCAQHTATRSKLCTLLRKLRKKYNCWLSCTKYFIQKQHCSTVQETHQISYSSDRGQWMNERMKEWRKEQCVCWIAYLDIRPVPLLNIKWHPLTDRNWEVGDWFSQRHPT